MQQTYQRRGNRWLLVSLPAAALAAGALVTSGRSQERVVAARWEYLVQFGNGSGVKPDRHQAQLDSLGREGWELVAAVGAQMAGNTGTVVLYLKRPTQ